MIFKLIIKVIFQGIPDQTAEICKINPEFTIWQPGEIWKLHGYSMKQ